MRTAIAKRTVQVAGWVTVFFGSLLAALSVRVVTIAQESFVYSPCNGPMCELQIAPINLDKFTAAYLIITGILLCLFGNRIRKADRKDTAFYFIAAFIADLAILFFGSLANISHAVRDDRLQLLLLLGFALHLICVSALVAWHQYRTKQNPGLLPGLSWWVKIPLLLFIVIVPALIYMAGVFING